MLKGTLLIVEQNRLNVSSLEKELNSEIEKVITLNDPGRINEILRKNEVDIVALGMNFRSSIHNGNEGLFWMKEILGYDKDISVIFVSESGDVQLAVKSIREGAVDFIPKPWERSKLLSTLNVAWQLRIARMEATSLKTDNQQLKNEINKGVDKLIQGASPTMINVLNTVRKVAATNANVLITGENGTGKELVAREIHNLSLRSAELMVSVDMGSITETLFESELFGHVKGAFTDAREDRKGKFEAADKGTLFLDEIGNLSLQSQAKLLNVLQTRRLTRVGSNKSVPFDIRLVCATNCDLVSRVREGRFREDLFYRINTIIIDVPPLRDRVDDIPILAGHFLRLYSERYGKGAMKINTHTLEKLADHTWPGNVRELQHAMEKAVILSDSSVLKPTDFSFSTQEQESVSTHDMSLAEMEKKLISDYIRRQGGNISVIAEKLGITRQTLYNKMRKYGL
jgi:DNA-binding NtrC family response regulator